jgi:carbamoyl-phosphate synthase small subunit
MPEAHLVLEDGAIFTGRSFGAQGDAHGEVVFTTSMTGYQEALTDPSFAGQILVMTYPLQGNYGVSPFDVESSRVQARAFVAREACDVPSHWRSQGTLDEYLASAGIPAIEGVDTRALTRRLRSSGVMMGSLTHTDPKRAIDRLRDLPKYDGTDFVQEVSVTEPLAWLEPEGPSRHIVVLDFGVKHNILRILRGLGCRSTVVPCTASADEILSLKPDGIVMSPGPGDPALLDYGVATASGLVGRVPIFGICLGHQVLARMWGAKTFKLKFGHRGANHPVRESATGHVTITAQNHGYAVDSDGLPAHIEVSHVHLNDSTCEGLRDREQPIFSIQYHSEASPGPRDNRHLFQRFLELVKEVNPK